MLTKIKDFFNNNVSLKGPGDSKIKGNRIEVAACALLLEMASIDNEFSEAERKGIISILEKEFGLADKMAEEVMELASQGLKESVDVWQFTSLINKNYSPAEKIQLIELVWRVIYADGNLDKHEDYLVKKLSRMLNLRHKEMIDAKLKVLGRSR
ncbi:MAG: TerB family tellurite resistance protein [bacterium]|nr:TerB family tellurite resistance protein [bacterium]